MAKYNSIGVPILDFHNPAGSIFYPKGLFTYAIGNTRGRDVTENFETKKGQHVDILLLASGDVRNLLATVSELSLRKADNRPKSINFHVNDYDPSIVARNLIILEIADTINPDVPADIDFLWNVWYNMTLSQADHARLRQVLTSLIERNFDGHASFLKFQSIDVLKECRTIWRDWRDLYLNVKSVKEERNRVFEEKNVQLTSLCCRVIFEIGMAPSDVTDIILPTSPFYQELEHWYREGSTDDDRLASVNATLIRPFVHKWKVHYSACPFQGYLPIESDELRRCGSLTSACKEILKLHVRRFQQFQKVTSVQIMSWTGDGLSLCTSGFLSKLLFDIIDTTNASDHIGLLNILVCCGPRLKRPNESQLFTSSMVWCGNGMCKSIEEYYNKCIGVNPYLLPTLLGLKLAENFDLGSRKLPDRINMTEEIFCWVKAEPKRTLLKLGESSDVVRALYILAERCFGLKEAWESQVYGAVLPSPLTLLRIIRQLQPLVDGRATRLLDLLHNNLSADFERKFGLSWNLIKASIGNEREPIVEVTIRINVDVPDVESTPMPEIVILDRSNANKKFRFQWEGTFPVIYNSLRYDERRRTVTFHLCENDWKKLKKESWLNIVSSNPGILIKSETVFLGNEDAIISVNQVDSVNTFGLFSVQEYNVCASQEDGHLLKVIKVEESKYSYKAELAICDLTKCQTANMTTNFHPDSCPTAVNVKFGDVNGCTMHFSCSVQESSSKFQISRKLGTVTCQIPKRPDGTVGELVLRNPAPIPFHALPQNIGCASVMQSCSKMFRTKLDQQRKLQRRSGSPFFNLRVSISIILENHVKHREIPAVYCLEDISLLYAPYQIMSDFLQKRGLVIIVEEIYKWKHVPIAKVLFYDCKRYGDIGRKNPTASRFTRVVESFFQVAGSLQICPIPADEKETNLFLTMLNINATRTSQKNVPNLVWKRSFISPIFPREINTNPFDQFIPERFTREHISPNFPFDFDSMLRQMLNVPPFNFDGDVAAASNSDRFKEPECGFCHAKSEDLKRCTGCNNIFYCSKDCQRRHWKLEHKTLCQK